MNEAALENAVSTNSTTSPSHMKTSISVSRATNSSPQPTVDKGIIIGSTIGGIALILVCMALVLYPVWRRRRRLPSRNPKRTSSFLSTSCPSPLPQTTELDLHMVRPVTPSPRRLAIDASVPSSAHPFGTVSMRWDVEKATVHMPSGHPAIVWRGDIFGNDSSPTGRTRPEGSAQAPAQQPEPSISTTFAAEMSSLLESISIKSSYSSLRSGGAVLGVPARLQTPLSVQKLRQDSCATTAGATRGSMSDGENIGPDSLVVVPSPAFPEDNHSMVKKGSQEDVHGSNAEKTKVGKRTEPNCEKL